MVRPTDESSARSSVTMRGLVKTLLKRLGESPVRGLVPMALRAAPRRLGLTIEVPAKTFWGEVMTVVLPEHVSNSIFRYGLHEEGLTTMVRTYLKPGMTFYDIGAHYGYFTLLASWIVGSSGRVHSFEPGRETYRVLAKNAHGKDNVILENVAVYSEEGTLEFHDYGRSLSAFNSLFAPRISQRTQEGLQISSYHVQCVPLDKYVRECSCPPDFVKIDAESAEYHILRGMHRTLQRFAPVVTIEVGDMAIPGASKSTDILRHIAGLGYRLMEYRKGEIQRHRLRDVYQYDNILCLPNRFDPAQ